MLFVKRILLLMGLVFTFAGAAAAQDGEFYFSFSADGATVGNPTGTFAAGESNSIFVYYSGNTSIDVAIDFELSTSIDEVIEITGGELFNNPAGDGSLNRWSGVSSRSLTSDGQIVQAFFGVAMHTLIGQPVGIDVDNPELDADYDAATDSFLLGRLDFDVIGQAGQQTELFAPFFQAVNNGAPTDVEFGTATIAIAIPEPTSTSVLLVGLIGMFARRRRLA